MQTIQYYKNELQELCVNARVLDKQINHAVSTLAHLDKEQHLLEKVNEFFTTQISTKIDDVKNKLESLVNQGLSFIFSDYDIKISIVANHKNNKTQFSLDIIQGKTIGRQDMYGGGVLAIIALLLKLSCIVITGTARFVIFDESLAFVSIEYQERVSLFLKELARELGFEIILIAHQPRLSTHANTIYEVTPFKIQKSC